MRLFKTYERDFSLFKNKNLKYINKLANIKICYRLFNFESQYKNCIITKILEGDQRRPIVYGDKPNEFILQFLSCENELKNAIVNTTDIDVFIDLI